MKPILVLYATREGQTLRIAEHIAADLSAQQMPSKVVDAAQLPPGFSLADYSAAIVSASVHRGKHEPEMVKFVKQHLAELQQVPSAFVSVSLAEAGAEDLTAPREKRAQAEADVKGMMDAFLADTGWKPAHIKAVAGALMYRKYNFVVRLIMKGIARKAGAPTDTSRNYEFTKWAGLDEMVKDLVESMLLEIRGQETHRPATA